MTDELAVPSSSMGCLMSGEPGILIEVIAAVPAAAQLTLTSVALPPMSIEMVRPMALGEYLMTPPLPMPVS